MSTINKIIGLSYCRRRSIIVLAEPRAVKAWGLRHIRDGGGTPGLT
jgi:hypothetical protein